MSLLHDTVSCHCICSARRVQRQGSWRAIVEKVVEAYKQGAGAWPSSSASERTTCWPS